MASDRRQFLRESGIALGAVTGGSVTVEALAPRQPPQLMTQEFKPLQQAGFGWEISDINNNGADVLFQVVTDMTLRSLAVDLAYMITAAPVSAGFAEVLCRIRAARGGPSAQASPASGLFGSLQVWNPNGLHVGFDPEVIQDLFFQVILKTWVPADGTASATSRNVRLEPLLSLNAGDFLIFHMDHLGVPGDVEMQVVLGCLPR
jgi:hypothetical protein